MYQPLISVIVPVYNVEKYLDVCIESIVTQTYQNLEIILVDDGSKDHSPEICDEWGTKDNRIKVIHKANGGASSARNMGLDVAKGDYIGFVDSDDYIEPNYYEFLLNICTEYSADIARCTYEIFIEFENNKPVDGNTVDKIITLTDNDLFLDLCHAGHKHVINVNKLFSRKALEGLHFDNTIKSGEDLVFNYFAYKKANKMVCHDLPLYHYRITGNQQTFDKNFNFKIYEAAKKIIEDEECPVCMYYKYYVFSSMLIHDILVNHYEYSFQELLAEIRQYKKKIVKACKEVGDRYALHRLCLLTVFPKLYQVFIQYK